MVLPVRFIKSKVVPFYAVQASAYLFGILSIPWLTRKLGVEGFGLYSYAIAFVTYFTLITDWGFNLSATKLVSVAAGENEVAEIVANTLAARLLLLIISTLVFALILQILPMFSSYEEYLWIAYIGVIGSALNTMFLYQGIEKPWHFAIQNIVVKLVSLMLIVVFVKDRGDLDLALGIQAISVLILSVVGLYMARNFVIVGISKLSVMRVCELVVRGWPLFLSSASISFYTNSNVIVLGLVSSLETVAYFSAAQTIAKGVAGLFYPAIQAVYPRLSQIASNSIERIPLLLTKLFLYFGVSGLFISVALMAASSYAIPLVYGAHFSEAVTVLEWLSPIVFFIAVSNVAGLAGLIPIGEEKIFSRILLLFGFLNIMAIGILGHFFGPSGGGAALLLTEMGVTCSMLFVLIRRGFLTFRLGITL